MTEAEKFAAIDAAAEAIKREGHPWDVTTEDGHYELTRAILIRAGLLSANSPRINFTRIIDDPDNPDIIIEAEIVG